MSQAPVLLETRPADGVAWLRLNRPEVLNALNLALRQALAESGIVPEGFVPPPASGGKESAKA